MPQVTISSLNSSKNIFSQNESVILVNNEKIKKVEDEIEEEKKNYPTLRSISLFNKFDKKVEALEYNLMLKDSSIKILLNLLEEAGINLFAENRSQREETVNVNHSGKKKDNFKATHSRFNKGDDEDDFDDPLKD